MFFINYCQNMSPTYMSDWSLPSLFPFGSHIATQDEIYAITVLPNFSSENVMLYAVKSTPGRWFAMSHLLTSEVFILLSLHERISLFPNCVYYGPSQGQFYGGSVLAK
ncbi:Hypothetical predicted protein [Xyrichtys novacula]|uniref:Uncharacterized protein n=1 Tax=Xyrichtys novacula TaxID=13765 RepID=A0AAV1FCT8_XYRNO|nr:Hypothetical predicted protein [Xyrichtys novacula]